MKTTSNHNTPSVKSVTSVRENNSALRRPLSVVCSPQTSAVPSPLSVHYPTTHADFHQVYQGTDVHQQYTELKTQGQLFQKSWMFSGQPYTHIQFIDTIYLLDTPQEEDIPSLLVIIYDELDEKGEGAQPFFMTIRQIYTEYIKSHFTEKQEP